MPRAPPRERAPPPPKYRSKDFAALAPPTSTDKTPLDDTVTVHSAARRVYELPECRLAIVRWLKGKELKAMIRVTRRGMFDVAKELYRDVRYPFAQNKMFIGTERQRTYCSAVSTVSASFKDLPEPMRKKIDKAALKQDTPEGYFGTYDPAICKFLTEQLRGKLPGLRKIIYEREEQSADPISWIVHCHSPSNHSPNSGIVEVVDDLICDLSLAPPTPIPTPLPPTPAYIIRRRFDLTLQSRSGVPQAMIDSWLEAIRNHPLFSNIYQSVNLSTLPVTLSDLASLYRRQIECGHTERIQTIMASSCVLEDIADFITLAKVASTSLTSLILADQYPQQPPGLSFPHLPYLVSAITSHLPNLNTLHIALSDVNSAEAVCSDLLTPNGLERSGPFNSIIIFTAPYHVPLFNTIRYLAPLCRPYVLPTITEGLSRVDTSYWDKHTAWLATLKYLRSRPPISRAYLAMIDFPSALGVDTLAKVQQLKYGEDGKPQRLR